MLEEERLATANLPAVQDMDASLLIAGKDARQGAGQALNRKIEGLRGSVWVQSGVFG